MTAEAHHAPPRVLCAELPFEIAFFEKSWRGVVALEEEKLMMCAFHLEEVSFLRHRKMGPLINATTLFDQKLLEYARAYHWFCSGQVTFLHVVHKTERRFGYPQY